MTRTTLFASALTLALAGCGSSNDATGGGDGGSDLVQEVPCSQETRATPYSAGMSETTPNGTVIRIMDATPAPPHVGQTASGEYNVWTIQVSGAGDAGLVSGATVSVDPYMPDHSHHAPFKPTVKANGEGTYSATRVDFNMPGFWQVTISVKTATGTQRAVFPLCAE
jgi:hypothetical protein